MEANCKPGSAHKAFAVKKIVPLVGCLKVDHRGRRVTFVHLGQYDRRIVLVSRIRRVSRSLTGRSGSSSSHSLLDAPLSLTRSGRNDSARRQLVDVDNLKFGTSTLPYYDVCGQQQRRDQWLARYGDLPVQRRW